MCGIFCNVFDVMAVFINHDAQIIDILCFITLVKCRNNEARKQRIIFLCRISRNFVHSGRVFHFLPTCRLALDHEGLQGGPAVSGLIC